MPRHRSLSTLLLAVLVFSSGVAATAAAAPAQSPSDAVYRKLCLAIRPQHVRPLFAGAVAPIRLGGDADCAFSVRGGDPEVGGVKVFLRIDDGDRTLWAHRGDRPYGAFRRLAAPGRLAKWGYEGGRLPSVVDARRGSFTCTVIPIGTAGLAAPSGPALGAARTYAQRLLRLCDDVYAAQGYGGRRQPRRRSAGFPRATPRGGRGWARSISLVTSLRLPHWVTGHFSQ